MGGRQVAVLAAAAALLAAGCGDESPVDSEQTRTQMDRAAQSRRQAVDRMIAEGKLPPVAKNVLNLNGTLNVNFIDGPKGDRDVVRTDANGTRGKKLVWDLDQNGRIDRSERTITERELYDATLGIH